MAISRWITSRRRFSLSRITTALAPDSPTEESFLPVSSPASSSANRTFRSCSSSALNCTKPSDCAASATFARNGTAHDRVRALGSNFVYCATAQQRASGSHFSMRPSLQTVFTAMLLERRQAFTRGGRGLLLRQVKKFRDSIIGSLVAVAVGRFLGRHRCFLTPHRSPLFCDESIVLAPHRTESQILLAHRRSTLGKLASL